MNDPFLNIFYQDQSAAAGLSFILVAVAYVILKTLVWWILFGTGKLLLGKYSLHEWGFRSLTGLAGMGGLVALSAYLLYMYDADSTVYWTILWVSLFFALRIWLREIFSLFGLLRGDWNPFHPELRFMAWHETYIFSLFGNGKSNSNDDCVWGKSMDRAYKLEDAYWGQQRGIYY